MGGGNYLYISWTDRPPISARNVWRVNGNINFEDGKATFQIANGNTVKIYIDQINTIGVSGNMMDKIEGMIQENVK